MSIDKERKLDKLFVYCLCKTQNLPNNSIDEKNILFFNFPEPEDWNV